MLDGVQSVPLRLARSIENTRWTPLREVRKGLWSMQCSCGTVREVRLDAYRNGRSMSCGCYREELSRAGIGKYRLAEGESARRQLLLIYKKGAERRGHAFTLTRDQFFEITTSICHYCGRVPAQRLDKRLIGSNGVAIYNGIDRLDNSAGYTRKNCVSCCKVCNYAKHNMTYEAFLGWLDDLVKYRTKANA